MSASANANEPNGTGRTRTAAWFGRLAGVLARILLLIMIVVGGLLWYLWNSIQTEPDFYSEALQQQPELAEAEGKEFESRVFELQNTLQNDGAWRATFTESQINGWLSSDMPEKFPRLLPPEISNPRVSVAEGEIQVAFRWTSSRLNGVVVIKGDIFSTAENEIGVQIKSMKSGVIPLPLANWADDITQSLQESGIAISWTELDGDPVAVIPVPELELQRTGRDISISSIESKDGEVVISGNSISPEEDSENLD